LGVALSLFSTDLAQADGWRARVVARVDPDEPFRAAPVQARVGERVELAVILIDDDGAIHGAVDRVSLRRRRVRTPAGPLPEGAEVGWRRVTPRLLHTDYAPPNPGIATFSNNILTGPEHGEWLGYDRLEYEMAPVPSAARRTPDGHLIVSAAAPTRIGFDYGGAGSNWFAARVLLPDGEIVATPDADDVDRYGLSPEVLRVSFRGGDDYLGWLSSYFNVPNLFGSAGPSDRRHQTERYVGADCADVLVGALRASGEEVGYTSISGIDDLARSVTEVLILDADGVVRALDGQPVEVGWGDDIAPGDLVVINYEDDPSGQLPRRWDHVGALVRDQSPGGAANGRLDGADVIRHMGYFGLTDATLSTQGRIRLRVWRWRL
jgi:hypothetical protein